MLKVCASREAARSVGAASARSVSGGRPPLDTALPAVGSAQKTRGTLFFGSTVQSDLQVIVKLARSERRKILWSEPQSELRSEVQAAVSVVVRCRTLVNTDLKGAPLRTPATCLSSSVLSLHSRLSVVWPDARRGHYPSHTFARPSHGATLGTHVRRPCVMLMRRRAPSVCTPDIGDSASTCERMVVAVPTSWARAFVQTTGC